MADALGNRQLDARQITDFRRDGYVVVRSMIEPNLVSELKADYERALRGEIQLPHFEGRRGEGAVVQLACPSRHIPGWADHAYMARSAALAKQLLGEDQEYVYDQLIFKPPHSSSPTAWHQDAAYWGGEPAKGQNAVTCWLALSPAFLENGCMQFVPGSHLGPLQPHYSIAGKSEITEALATDVDDRLAVPCPLEPGDASFHHSLTLHYTGPNSTDVPRLGLITHFMQR